MTNSLYQCIPPNHISCARALSLSALVPPCEKWSSLCARTRYARTIRCKLFYIVLWALTNTNSCTPRAHTHTHTAEDVRSPLQDSTVVPRWRGYAHLLCTPFNLYNLTYSLIQLFESRTLLASEFVMSSAT